MKTMTTNYEVLNEFEEVKMFCASYDDGDDEDEKVEPIIPTIDPSEEGEKEDRPGGF